MHVFALIEALSVTGPAKNLIQFARIAPTLDPPLKLTFLTFRRPHHPSSDSFLDACREAAIDVLVIPESGPWDFRTLLYLKRLIAQHKPDILQTHSIKSHFLLWISGLWRKLPWVAFHHGYTLPTKKQSYYNRLGALAIARAKVCITVTRAFVEELTQVGVPLSRIQIVANAIDPDWFVATKAPTVHERKQILAIGRLSKEKGHADLVEAVALLPERSCELVLVGEGFERENLAALAKLKNVQLRFAGQVEDVRPFFADADVFVLPSHSEGSPNVLIEAMAAAKPIVATTAGGIPYTVTHEEHALLVPPSEPAKLAGAIKRLIDDPDLAQLLSHQAKDRLALEFSPLARAKRIAAVYQSLR